MVPMPLQRSQKFPPRLKFERRIKSEFRGISGLVSEALYAEQVEAGQPSFRGFASPDFRSLARVRKAVNPVNKKERLALDPDIAPVLEDWNE
jgi:hypothetical protein